MARPPKPTALKVIHGTDRADRINPDEPDFNEYDGECPKFMPNDAKKIWKQFYEIMTKSGVLRENSIGIYNDWCIAEAKTRKLAKKTDKESTIEWRQLTALKRMLATELGMTPASQTKIKAGKSEKGKKTFLDGIWEKKNTQANG